MKILSAKISKHFKLVTIRPGKHSFKDWGVIDFTTISLDEAQILYDKGFPFLQTAEKTKETPTPHLKITEAAIETAKEVILFDPKKRFDKKYINTLLTWDWNDLARVDQELFFFSEAYFLSKKQLLIQCGDIYKKMVSLHAKQRTMAGEEFTDDQRKEVVQELAGLDDTRSGYFKTIDTWNEADAENPIPKDKLDTSAIANLTLDLQRKIDVDKLWISRAEKTLPGMKTDSAVQVAKKTSKQGELLIRKRALETNKPKLLELL